MSPYLPLTPFFFLLGPRGEQMISILSPAIALTAPAFAFVFPLLTQVMRDRAKQISKEKREIALNNCMAIVLKHAGLRQKEDDGEDEDDEVDEDDDFTDEMEITGPKYLPRVEMMSLMLDLISRESGKKQTEAATCLVEVAKSASGMRWSCVSAFMSSLELLRLRFCARWVFSFFNCTAISPISNCQCIVFLLPLSRHGRLYGSVPAGN